MSHPALDSSSAAQSAAATPARSGHAPARTTPAGDNIATRLLACGADNAPALIADGTRVSYSELRAAVDALAGRLAAAQPAGARVGLVAENGPFFVVAYLATIRAGLCVVPIPTAVQRDWLTRVAADTDMALLLASRRMAGDEDLQAVHGRSDFAIWVQDEAEPLEVADTSAPAGRLEVDTEVADWRCRAIEPSTALAALFFTSGSTGAPKGVMVSHRNIETNTRDIVEYMGLTDQDRAMVVLPLHYCYGLSVLHTHLAAGASIVFNNIFMFPEKVLDDIVAQECTGFAGVPSHFQILLRKTRFPTREFPRLRWLQQAGGKLPDPFIAELRAAHPNTQLFIMYGQTEATARLSYLPPQRLDDKVGSIGQGLASTILEVVDDAGHPVAPGSGAVGEIVATGDNVTLGYWRDSETSERYFAGGKLRTRDLATVDAEGFIFIVDRARDFIKSMGNRISPKEVEDVIAALPEVVEVAVIGVPDATWGEAVKATVVLVRPDALTAAEVTQHCNARLPNYKMPSQVEVVAALPKNESGKVLKAELRRQAARAAADQAATEAAEPDRGN